MPILILALVMLLNIVLFGTGLYFFDTAIRSDSLVRKMRGTVISRDTEPTPFFDEMKEKGLLEDVYMQSEDGLLLHGIMTRRETERDGDGPEKWAVICHGYTTYAAYMSDYAELFDRMGFSTLSVDMRGHGGSAGTYRGMGWHDSFDIMDWTDWLTEHYGEDISVVLFGISMGGAAVMMASGHDVPGCVKCIIEDCGYTSIKDELKYQIKKRYGLPSFPLLNALSFWTRIFCGYSILKDGNAVRQVRASKTPILFIHGEADDYVPFKMHKKLYKSAGCEKESYTVENAGHCMSFKTDKNEYFRTISAFCGRYLDVAESMHL